MKQTAIMAYRLIYLDVILFQFLNDTVQPIPSSDPNWCYLYIHKWTGVFRNNGHRIARIVLEVKNGNEIAKTSYLR